MAERPDSEPRPHNFLSPRRAFVSILATFSTALLALPAASSAMPPVRLSGAYTGPANVKGLAEFGQLTGTPATVALDFLPDFGWGDIENPGWYLNAWRPFRERGGTLVLSVPMLVDSPTSTFAAGAAGDYDEYYDKLGHDLVSSGYRDAVLRIGWEFNGTWFPWSVNNGSPAMDSAAFVADWRHLVDLLRAVPGSNFKFDWTVNPGPSGVPAADAYPGDAYVDYVGVDLYDSSWDAYGGPIRNATARWNQLAKQQYGLNWWLRFAKAHGKPITIPEWGLNTDQSSNGAGDDPSFIEHMYMWMKVNKPAFEAYFDYGSSALGTGADPESTAEFHKLFETSAITSTKR